MRRSVLPWLAALGAIVIALSGGLVAVNATALGAPGFVRLYLDLLSRGDADGALDLPGVRDGLPELAADLGLELADIDDTMLARAALPGLDDIRQVSDVEGEAGTRLVTVAWTSDGVDGETTFTVEPDGTRLGLFPEWRFAVSPIAIAQLDVRGDLRYRVGELDANTTGSVMPTALLAPGRYVVEHETEYLRADPVEVLVDAPAAELPVRVDVEAGPRFVDEVSEEVDRFLDECTTQRVLQPSGCPFGFEVADRIDGEPVWSMVEYPRIRLVPGDDIATWRVPATPAVAHLRVDIRSLFDGSVREYDEDEPFEVRFLVQFTDDGGLAISAQPGD